MAFFALLATGLPVATLLSTGSLFFTGDRPPAQEAIASPQVERAPPSTLPPEEIRRPSSDFYLTVTSATELRQALATAPPQATISISSPQPLHIKSGPLLLDRTVTIRGANGPAQLTTGGTQGLFVIAANTAVRLQDLHIEDAAGPDQPAITNAGLAFVDGVKFRANQSNRGPSALTTSGQLIGQNLVLVDNHSASGPGAIAVDAGSLHLRDITARGNRAARGSVITNQGTAHLRRAQFTENRAHEGGAIYNSGALHLRDATFVGNRGIGGDSFGAALLSEGQAWLTNTTFINNQATFGSAVVVDQGHLHMAHSTFENNPNLAGSDLYVGPHGQLTIRNSILSRPAHTAMSVDAVYGATINSEGGNIVPGPDFSWPTDPANASTPPTTDDILGAFGQSDRFALETSPDDSPPHTVRPGPEHPARHHIPGPRCRDAYGHRLFIDHADNRRHCDAGAHQISSPPPVLAAHSGAAHDPDQSP